MKRIFLFFAAAIVVMMYAIIQLLQRQNELMELSEQIHKETSHIYNVFSGYQSVESIDLIYDE